MVDAFYGKGGWLRGEGRGGGGRSDHMYGRRNSRTNCPAVTSFASSPLQTVGGPWLCVYLCTYPPNNFLFRRRGYKVAISPWGCIGRFWVGKGERKEEGGGGSVKVCRLIDFW